MPNSVMVGSRPPSSCLIFSYSSGVRPCSRTRSGVMAGAATVVMGKDYCRMLGGPPHVQSSHTSACIFAIALIVSHSLLFSHLVILSELALALARGQCSRRTSAFPSHFHSHDECPLQMHVSFAALRMANRGGGFGCGDHTRPPATSLVSFHSNEVRHCRHRWPHRSR